VDAINAALTVEDQGPQAAVDLTAALPLFNELAEALKYMNAGDIDRILKELSPLAVDSKTRTTLDSISDHVLLFEFDKARETVETLLK
jgi:hypothetical protein